MLLATLPPVFIVAYHRPTDAKLCLDSLTRHKPPARTYLLDNSQGELDQLLARPEYAWITTIASPTNLGKSKAFMAAKHLLHGEDSFILMDHDVIVDTGWYECLAGISYQLDRFLPWALLAPSIQTGRHSQSIHGPASAKLSETLYACKCLGGPLLLINRHFFDAVGGLDDRCLYGGDDGHLSRLANAHQLFVGFTTTVVIKHSQLDETVAYKQWKRQAIGKAGLVAGHWDNI